MYILPFESAFGYFKGVVVYLYCICFVWCYWALFIGWSGLFCLWLPGNPVFLGCLSLRIPSGVVSPQIWGGH